MAASRRTTFSSDMVVVLFLLGISLPVSYGKSKFVSMNLDGKWSSTPLLLEASEFLAEEDSDYFWRFVDRVISVNVEEVVSTDKGYYELIQRFAGKYLQPLQLRLMKFALSLRTYSPTIEMYNQISREAGPPSDCEAFVSVQGEITCDVEKISEILESDSERVSPMVYPFDHVYPGTSAVDRVVFLYAELGKESFKSYHRKLQDMAHKREIQYVLRHYVQTPSETKVRLSGYGVELAIKSTEYKAKDDTKVEGDNAGDGQIEEEGEDEEAGFIFSTLRQLHPDLKEGLREFKSHLSDSATELVPLKVWQFQDLSLQAAQRVMQVKPNDALEVLKDISQNFPTATRSLVNVVVTDDLKDEIKKNQKYYESANSLLPGESALYLNGLPVDMDVYDIFTLFDVIRSEGRMMEGLFSLGAKGEQLTRLLKLDLQTGVENYAIDIRHSAVQYLNDLERDSQYRKWPNSVQDILRPTFPGMLRHVAKNFFHLVFILNPADPGSRDLLRMAEAFYVHSAPVRVGVVLSVNAEKSATGLDDPGIAFLRAFNFIKLDEDLPKALGFITDVYERFPGNITAEDVITQFSKQYKDEDLDMVFGDNDDYDDMRKASADFVTKTGLGVGPHVLMNGVPLSKEYLAGDSFEEGVVMEITKGTNPLQTAVYRGELHDGDDILEWLMTKDNVLPRLNSRVLDATEMNLDFTENIDGDIYNDPEVFALMSARDVTSIMASNMKYLTRKDEDASCAVTMWIICDLATPQGRDLLYGAIKHLKSSSDLRVGIIFNPSSTDQDNYINKAVYAALRSLPGNIAKSFVTKLVKEEYVEDLKSGAKTLDDLEVHGMDTKAYEAALDKQSEAFLQVHRSFVEKTLNYEPGARGLVANGKVIGPLRGDEDFSQEDINLLYKFTSQVSGKKIKEEVTKMGLGATETSDLIMKIGALLTTGGQKASRKEVKVAAEKYSVMVIPGSSDSPAFDVDAIFDPVSREAQKLAPILMVLKDIVNVNIKLYMNCQDKLSEMPLKRFYRYVLEPEVTFHSDGSFTSGPYAHFTDLPQKSLLTLNMDPPESWLVEPVRSPHDLDNILLEEVDRGVSADFELEYLLLEGHCHDSTTGQPPRGLQITLGTKSSPVIKDTIVMANLGYFQLKANPGAWLLQLREGRSREIYNIASHEHTDSLSGSSDIVVAIRSFKSRIIRVKVAKKPDRKLEELLNDKEDGDSEDDGGLWGSISRILNSALTLVGVSPGSFTGEKKKDKQEEGDKTLNIFSLASGHLYERFLRIMMMSVLKHTKSKVKFWFLKNYLSPTVKEFIPHMAEKYGFEYELVQYKWPRWLNQQKEKQRIIWGYKILFLDVLFPLDVKKFIFVDADQIVRADLQELSDLDLGGAPYGYTPFCDSRKEMDGFRFWRSGYWAGHLAGRKYHISALYVVDLKKFRQVAAGDRLRGQYQGLSQDPNSLSNLDQDLPNNMIHQVYIKSLPQEWLWCETWCSTEELANAKTIDLCNNPLTKEPKLTAAMRIVPEWKDYDYEIKVLWDEVYGTNTRLQTEYEKPPSTDAPKDEL